MILGPRFIRSLFLITTPCLPVSRKGMMVIWLNRCMVCQHKRNNGNLIGCTGVWCQQKMNDGDLIGCTGVWCVREQARRLRWPTSPWPRALVPQPLVSCTSHAVAAAQAFKHWISRALKICSDLCGGQSNSLCCVGGHCFTLHFALCD